MRKIIIIPDSFKGTLSSKDACCIMADAARKSFPHADVIAHDIGKAVDVPGAGAAGGMGAGVIAFFNGRLVRGIDALLGLANFDKMLLGADIVLTGEGRFDRQSLMGKAVGGIAKRAQKAGVPVVCVARAIENDIAEAYRAGIAAVFSINRPPIPFEEAVCHTRENLADTTENILRLLKAKFRTHNQGSSSNLHTDF